MRCGPSDFVTRPAAAYEPVDRNFDAIELSAECSIAYVDMMAIELQVRGIREALRACTYNRDSVLLRACSPWFL